MPEIEFKLNKPTTHQKFPIPTGGPNEVAVQASLTGAGVLTDRWIVTAMIRGVPASMITLVEGPETVLTGNLGLGVLSTTPPAEDDDNFIVDAEATMNSNFEVCGAFASFSAWEDTSSSSSSSSESSESSNSSEEFGSFGAAKAKAKAKPKAKAQAKSQPPAKAQPQVKVAPKAKAPVKPIAKAQPKVTAKAPAIAKAKPKKKK